MTDTTKIAKDLANIFAQCDDTQPAFDIAYALAGETGVNFVLCIGKDGTNHSQGFQTMVYATSYMQDVCPVAGDCKFKFCIWT